MRRLESMLSGSMVIRSSEPGDRAGCGGSPGGDDGGVGWAGSTVDGGTVSGCLVTTSIPRAWCRLAETAVRGRLVTGNVGGVGGGEVSEDSPPLDDRRAWSGCSVLLSGWGADGTKAGTWSRDRKMDGGGCSWTSVVTSGVMVAGSSCSWLSTSEAGEVGGGVAIPARSVGDKSSSSGSHIWMFSNPRMANASSLNGRSWVASPCWLDVSSVCACVCGGGGVCVCV